MKEGLLAFSVKHAEVCFHPIRRLFVGLQLTATGMEGV